MSKKKSQSVGKFTNYVQEHIHWVGFLCTLTCGKFEFDGRYYSD